MLLHRSNYLQSPSVTHAFPCSLAVHVIALPLRPFSFLPADPAGEAGSSAIQEVDEGM